MATKKDKTDKKDKQADFVKLANKRVPKALKAIALIGNLGGSGYAHTAEQGDAIIAALNTAVQKVEKQLAGEVDAESGFKL